MTNGLRPSGSSPTADTPSYDLVVIGSGPGGQKAAIAAAKLGKSVAVVERDNMLGGVCTNTGTIPSKTLREAVLYLTGMNQRELYGASYRVKANITPEDLLARTEHVIRKEIEVVRAQLQRNRIDLISGIGRFADEHTVVVEEPSRGERTTLHADYVVIATGTNPARPDGVAFDEACPGLGRHLKSAFHSGIDGRRGRRCHRHRVRVHVRRPGHQGDRGGKA